MLSRTPLSTFCVCVCVCVSVDAIKRLNNVEVKVVAGDYNRHYILKKLGMSVCMGEWIWIYFTTVPLHLHLVLPASWSNKNFWHACRHCKSTYVYMRNILTQVGLSRWDNSVGVKSTEVSWLDSQAKQENFLFFKASRLTPGTTQPLRKEYRQYLTWR